MASYKLKEGVTFRPFGTGVIDNTNLTDTIAEFLLESGRATKEDFVQEEKKQPLKKNK